MKRSGQVRNPGRNVKSCPLIILALSIPLFLRSSNLWTKPACVSEAEKAVRGCDSLKQFERIGCKQL
jgi:hypothetical protein